MLEINSKIDDFTLEALDENGEETKVSLSDYKGQNIVLYFYPKDNTPGCTTESCDFRDNLNRITTKAVVLGVSPDNLKSHKKFQEKYSLNFPLLSDPEHTLMEYLGVWGEKSMYGKKYMGVIRSTFIIDKDGVLKKEWRKVRVKGHVDAVIEALEEI